MRSVERPLSVSGEVRSEIRSSERNPELGNRTDQPASADYPTPSKLPPLPASLLSCKAAASKSVAASPAWRSPEAVWRAPRNGFEIGWRTARRQDSPDCTVVIGHVCLPTKPFPRLPSAIRNSKSESRNPKQIQRTKSRMTETIGRTNVDSAGPSGIRKIRNPNLEIRNKFKGPNPESPKPSVERTLTPRAPRQFAKSEIRIAKSETNSKDQIQNDRNHRSNER